MIALFFIITIAGGALAAYLCVYDEDIAAKNYAARYNRQQRIREKAMRLIDESQCTTHRCPTGGYEEGHCPACHLRDQCYPSKTSQTAKEAEETIEFLPSIHSDNEDSFLTDSPDCCPNCYEDDLCRDHDDGRFFAYASDEAYNEWYREADEQETRNDNNSLF